METKNKKILIYTEEPHDSFDEVLIEKYKESEVYLLGSKKKIKRLKKSYKENNIYFLKKLYLPTKKENILKRIIIPFLNLFILFKDISKYKFDEIVFSTLQDEITKRFFFFFVNNSKINITISIHNINYWFFYDHKIFEKQYKDFFINRNYSYFLNKKIEKYIVLTDYLKKKIEPYINKKEICVLPFKKENKLILKKRFDFISREENIPTFIIPGNVDNKRKDYNLIIDAFEKVKSNYKLIFLGKTVDSKIIEKAKNNLKEKIIFFEEYIDEKTFENYMINSHFILTYDNKKLPYGILKASGIEFDGKVYMMPVLINKDSIYSELEISEFIFYDKYNLSSFINDLIMDINLGKYKKKYFDELFKELEEK